MKNIPRLHQRISLHQGVSAKGMAALGGLFLLLLIARFLWIPWYLETRAARAQLEQLRWSQESRQRGIVSAITQSKNRLEQLKAEWRARKPALYTAISPTAAGTALIRRVQQLASESDIVLLSANLLPVDQLQEPARIGAEVRADGAAGELLAFLHRLSVGMPVHVVTRLRMDVLPNGQGLHIEAVVSAMALISPRPDEYAGGRSATVPTTAAQPVESISLSDIRSMGLFGSASRPGAGPVAGAGSQKSRPESLTYRSDWHLSGVVYGTPMSMAILKNVQLGTAQDHIVGVGDRLGEEEVVAIESTYVVLRKGKARAVLLLSP